VFSACYIGKISRFARNDMLLRLFTRPSNLVGEKGQDKDRMNLIIVGIIRATGILTLSLLLLLLVGSLKLPGLMMP